MNHLICIFTNINVNVKKERKIVEKLMWVVLKKLLVSFRLIVIEVKSMQRSGTEAIRTQLQTSKPKREITNITNSQNTKRTYGKTSEQLFPKRWPLSNGNQTKNNMNTRKVKRHQTSDTKNRQQRTTTKLPPWNGR